MLGPGDVIGPYTLTRFLGRGSFGEVWLGENASPITSTVFAIKIAHNPTASLHEIKKEADIWKQVSNHPNVLPLIEANRYGGHVVIVSHYRQEGSLHDWLTTYKGSRPPLKVAIDMMSGVLDGLQHLHDAKIIHRDLKPANILLQKSVPQLADFGLSSVLRSTSVSSTVAGTPAYMAPEAFAGGRTAQADIWSVGVILYEILTGSLPFSGANVPELMEAIRKRRAAPLPSTVPLALRKVVEKALQKNKAKRYKSAEEMRNALQQAAKLIPDDSQVSTLPPADMTPMLPRTSSLPRMLRRQGMRVALGLIILATAYVLVTMFADQGASRRDGTARQVSANVPPEASATSAGVITKPAQTSQPPSLRGRVESLGFTPDGNTLAAAITDGTLRMWDAKAGTVRRTLKGGKFGVLSVAFTPDSKLMAVMDYDGAISLWDMRTVEVKRMLAHNPKRDFGTDTGTVLFSPNGRMLASIHHNGEVKLWDTPSGDLIRTLDLGFKGSMPSLAFSPDGKMLASGNGDWSRETSGEVRLWGTRSGKLLRTLKPDGARNWVMSLAFSPDGKTLAAGTHDAKIAVWNALSGELMWVLTDNLNNVQALAFSPDGKTLASGSNDRMVRLWDTLTWTVRNSLTGHSSLVAAIAFSKDGKTLASGGEDNSVIIWDALTGGQRLRLQAHD